MKKKWIIIIVISTLVLIVVSLVFGLLFLFKKKVGDIRPAILPALKPKVGQTIDYLKLPAGYKIGIFANDLGNARDLVFSPNGILLVSATENGQIIAVADKNSDGTSDENKVILSGLNRPHGLAFYLGKLYVAQETKLTRYNFDENSLVATKDKDIMDLPAGGQHFTRTIVFRDNQMYVSIGSTCDVCLEKNPFNASVIVVDPEGNNPKVYAKGLRNAVFMILNDKTNQIWATEMGRDFLGDDLPPDEINILLPGDYGWPYCYGNKVVDNKFNAKANCGGTTSPVYEIPAHSAPLGLVFIDSTQFSMDEQGNLLVAYHGSWNRSTPIGYKVVKLKVDGDKINSSEDFITGFLQGSQVIGRPVDLAFDPAGSLYLSDDRAGVVYKIIKAN
ncbi:MAG: PQQ-dependent sugar dehydrogenase [bacterium]|nr:PQQ-dependent sugar dehydrogenase [bacterium]